MPPSDGLTIQEPGGRPDRDVQATTSSRLESHTQIRAELERRVDVIESSYEFMLAYAAQGSPSDAQSANGPQLRERLGAFHASLAGLAELYRDLLRLEQPDRHGAYEAYLDILAQDARAAQAGLQVVLTQPTISSQLVDNLNASIHVRALLTDVFLVDELLKSQ